FKIIVSGGIVVPSNGVFMSQVPLTTPALTAEGKSHLVGVEPDF
ncbi:MAG: hypothetical protein RLZZ29_661, partial [Cyanobacteriota bacterium]